MTDAALTACAGFLLAVLWMDLMFDSQIRSGEAVIAESTLASIAGYYRRVTTTSRPRGALIAAVMAALLGLIVIEAVSGDTPPLLLVLSAVLAGGPILLAVLRTVPNAVRLGARGDDTGEQGRLARAIYRDHLFCLAAVSAFLALWLTRTLLF